MKKIMKMVCTLYYGSITGVQFCFEFIELMQLVRTLRKFHFYLQNISAIYNSPVEGH
jgi:hypothetical protein